MDGPLVGEDEEGIEDILANSLIGPPGGNILETLVFVENP